MADHIQDATFCSAVHIEPKVCELFNIYESSQIRVHRRIHRIRIHRMERLLLPMMGVVGITATSELFQKSKEQTGSVMIRSLLHRFERG